MNQASRRPEVAILAIGDMGSWIARRLVPHGVRVRTVLAGRSPGSAARAAAAGVQDVGDDDALVAGIDAVLSIVPPGSAFDLARRLAPALARAATKPVYVDCNAISRGTVRQVEACIAASGCDVVDGAIFGSAPSHDGPGPRTYLSGISAAKVAFLGTHGLDVQVLDAPVGSASALKCCFAALGKGVAALGAEAVLAATRADVADALRHELRTVFPGLAQLLQRLLPESYGKAHRWVAEMEEISQDFEGVPGGPATNLAAAELFAAIAASAKTRGTNGNLIDILETYVTGKKTT